MTGIEQLQAMDKESLIDLIEYLYLGRSSSTEIPPQGYSVESDYKDALYSGMIDSDMEFTEVTPQLSNVTFTDGIAYLNGDKVDLIPEYKTINLYCKGFKITGLIKAEILARMIMELPSLKIGVYMGWSKYLVQYKKHTLVINTSGALAGMKLLKYDHIARQMYTKQYPKRPILEWSEIDDDEKIYGSKDISIPHAVDNMAEEVVEAIGILERGMKYPQVKQIIDEYGWYNDPI